MVLLQPMRPEVPKPVVDPGFCVFEFIFLFRLWNCFMFKLCSLSRGWIGLSTSLFTITFFQWPSCVLFFVSNHSFFVILGFEFLYSLVIQFIWLLRCFILPWIKFFFIMYRFLWFVFLASSVKFDILYIPLFVEFSVIVTFSYCWGCLLLWVSSFFVLVCVLLSPAFVFCVSMFHCHSSTV